MFVKALGSAGFFYFKIDCTAVYATQILTFKKIGLESFRNDLLEFTTIDNKKPVYVIVHIDSVLLLLTPQATTRISYYMYVDSQISTTNSSSLYP